MREREENRIGERDREGERWTREDRKRDEKR